MSIVIRPPEGSGTSRSSADSMSACRSYDWNSDCLSLCICTRFTSLGADLRRNDVTFSYTRLSSTTRRLNDSPKASRTSRKARSISV